jgi:hypothetical protein
LTHTEVELTGSWRSAIELEVDVALFATVLTLEITPRITSSAGIPAAPRRPTKIFESRLTYVSVRAP